MITNCSSHLHVCFELLPPIATDSLALLSFASSRLLASLPRSNVSTPISVLRILLPFESVNSGFASKKFRFTTTEKRRARTAFVSNSNDLTGRRRVRPIERTAQRDTLTRSQRGFFTPLKYIQFQYVPDGLGVGEFSRRLDGRVRHVPRWFGCVPR
jgi:hypothetical protein